MVKNLKEGIKSYLAKDVDVCGFAPVERFAEAPAENHPTQLIKGARTVIVFGIKTPRGVIDSPHYSLYGLHRAYHSIYRRLDEVAVYLCNFLEGQGPYRAMPVPSFAPLTYRGREPWGLISLKHAAVRAGLGSMGRSGQVYHPSYGALLRFGAVVTDAPVEGDEMLIGEPCPPLCQACMKVCPAKAFDSEGNFDKMLCLSHTIKHAIYPLALKGQADRAHMERVINTAGYDYWVACCECLRVCPLNRMGRD